MANDTEPLLASVSDDGTFAYRAHPHWQMIAEGKQGICCCTGYATALGLEQKQADLFAPGLGLGLLLRPHLYAGGVAV